MPEEVVWLGLALLGAGVGAYGTLIGAGGGFLLTPALLLLYPDLQPEVVTAISLSVVWVNATSGSVAYGRQKRVDYVAASLFAVATLPGAVAGALATSLVPRQSFEAAFGLALLLIATWLLAPHPNRIVTTMPGRYVRRTVTDAHGDTYRYGFDPLLGVGLGLGVGVFSSMFGVGGGIIYVPAMILLLRFPAQIATATSTFTLMFTAGAGALVHLLSGHYVGVVAEELSLAVGVVIGAQIGAHVSEKLERESQAVVSRLLSAALVLVGVRLLVGVVVG
ncbi:MAG: TSUP family transporter [Dehalococcoidia bacterium]|nr:TSUP family transporter [Dehalococcoidia bacterium]